MGITSQDPEPGSSSGVARWGYLSVPNGAKAAGYKAGPAFWCWVHHVGMSKPCRWKMTRGALQCPDCSAGYQPTRRGYCPFYSREFARLFVLIGEDYAELWASAGRHEQVTFTRGKSKRAPLVPHRENWTTHALPYAQSRDLDAEILPALWTVWKMPDLREWHDKTSDNGVSQRRQRAPLPPMQPEVDAPKDPMVRAAWLKAVAENEAAKNRLEPVDVIGEVMPRPSKNGKHKPPG